MLPQMGLDCDPAGHEGRKKSIAVFMNDIMPGNKQNIS